MKAASRCGVRDSQQDSRNVAGHVMDDSVCRFHKRDLIGAYVVRIFGQRVRPSVYDWS